MSPFCGPARRAGAAPGRPPSLAGGMAAGGGQKRGGGGRGWGIWGSPRRTGAEDVCGRGAAWAATGAPVKTSEFSATWAFRKRPHFTEETADRLKLRIRDSIERTHATLTVSWTVSLSPERLREHQAHLLSSSQLHRVYRPLQRALALPRREPLCSPPPAWMGPLSLPPQATVSPPPETAIPRIVVHSEPVSDCLPCWFFLFLLCPFHAFLHS